MCYNYYVEMGISQEMVLAPSTKGHKSDTCVLKGDILPHES
jgi:hypothetical protein